MAPPTSKSVSVAQRWLKFNIAQDYKYRYRIIKFKYANLSSKNPLGVIPPYHVSPDPHYGVCVVYSLLIVNGLFKSEALIF